MRNSQNKLDFSEYQKHLVNLARLNLKPILQKRFSPEDIVQETMVSAYEKPSFFENNLDIPVFFKLRKLLFQTISDLERKHLFSQKRTAYNEVEIADNSNYSTAELNWKMFAASITSPSMQMVNEEKHQLLKKVLEELDENDRQIIELRNFDAMSNSDCAKVLKITEKNASIRYVRALQKLKNKLLEYSNFKNE